MSTQKPSEDVAGTAAELVDLQAAREAFLASVSKAVNHTFKVMDLNALAPPWGSTKFEPQGVIMRHALIMVSAEFYFLHIKVFLQEARLIGQLFIITLV